MSLNANDYVVVNGKKYYAEGGKRYFDDGGKTRKQIEKYIKDKGWNVSVDDFLSDVRKNDLVPFYNTTGDGKTDWSDEDVFNAYRWKNDNITNDMIPMKRIDGYNPDGSRYNGLDTDYSKNIQNSLRVDPSDPKNIKLAGINMDNASKSDIQNYINFLYHHAPSEQAKAFRQIVKDAQKQITAGNYIKPMQNISENEGSVIGVKTPIGILPFRSNGNQGYDFMWGNEQDRGDLDLEDLGTTYTDDDGNVHKVILPKLDKNGSLQYSDKFKEIFSNNNTNQDTRTNRAYYRNNKWIIPTPNNIEYDERGNVQYPVKRAYGGPTTRLFASGGDMGAIPMGEQSDYNMVGAGGSHEMNPQGGVPYGVNQDGSQNMVEQGEVSVGNNVFSDRTAISPELCQQLGLPEGTSHAQAMQQIEQLYEQGQIGDQEYQEISQILFQDQEAQKQGGGMPQPQNEGIQPEMVAPEGYAWGGRRRCR